MRSTTVAGVLLTIMAVGCTMNEEQARDVNTQTIYEPKFRHDGYLWILDGSAKDTIALLEIEVAVSDEEIQYGMMYRRSMAENRGMFFVMKNERPQSFWMKNTYIPLDIVYINSQKRIVSIQKDAEPLSERSLPSYEPALYVLEVNAGFCDRHGVKVGDLVLFEYNR
ncbi:DUF192 domain-containing protein [Schleiferia thermophila]|jgi:uncharacterized membrane protein (UPF0127 family)|uniref:DUF192 domain-containing protein n=1 Tax=Schleiferia thermophila TaxID=884107 RepID=UPI0004E72CFC|nr:DUF192 domain-containing protein [Schleiferia thermophila]KFD39121.1 hypothetical protein AT05_05945 [Schleiferia thermophila str. Yellowstone]